MTRYKVGYFVGSLSPTSINREHSQVLIKLAPEDIEFTEIPIGNRHRVQTADVVAERQVDHTVGVGGSGAKRAEVIEPPPGRRCASCLESLCADTSERATASTL